MKQRYKENRAEYNKEWYKNNKENKAEYNKQYNKNNKGNYYATTQRRYTLE